MDVTLLAGKHSIMLVATGFIVSNTATHYGWRARRVDSVVVVVVVAVLGPAGRQRRAGRRDALHHLQVALLVGRAVVHGARALALRAAAIQRVAGSESAATGTALIRTATTPAVVRASLGVDAAGAPDAGRAHDAHGHEEEETES